MSLASFDLSPGARREFDDTVDWYREQSPEAAERFVAAVHAGILRIVDSPLRWPENAAGERRLVLQGSPFALEYVSRPGHVTIVAIAHGSRDPEYWRRAGPRG